MKQTFNWEAAAKRARSMSDAALTYARQDCIEAGQAAFALEIAGCRVSKDQGYYLDESSVYATEQARRVEVAA